MSNVTETSVVCDWCEDKRPGLETPARWIVLMVSHSDGARKRYVHFCNRDHCHAVAMLLMEGKRAGLPKMVPE